MILLFQVGPPASQIMQALGSSTVSASMASNASRDSTPGGVPSSSRSTSVIEEQNSGASSAFSQVLPNADGEKSSGKNMPTDGATMNTTITATAGVTAQLPNGSFNNYIDNL